MEGVLELPELKRKYPALILPRGGIQAFANPPPAPDRCTFTRFSINYSADLKTEVQPCFFGGNPDCSRCGCAVSAGLHRVHEKPLAMGLKAGHLMDASLAVGRLFERQARVAR